MLSNEFENFHRSLSAFEIPKSEIFKSLQTINTNKGPGPDSIPPMFLKMCAEQLVIPLHVIFNKSLSSGCFPEIWKIAHITPIHKKGDPSDITNYRLISILSAMGKLFESLVQKRLLFHP